MIRNKFLKQAKRLAASQPLSTEQKAAQRLVAATASKAEPFLNGTSANYVEELYFDWLEDPKSVHASWRSYFTSVNAGKPPGSAYVAPPDMASSVLHPGALPGNVTKVSLQKEVIPVSTSVVHSSNIDENFTMKYKLVNDLIDIYQEKGHHKSKLDPLRIHKYGLSDPNEDSNSSLNNLIARQEIQDCINALSSDLDTYFDVTHMSTFIQGEDGSPMLKVSEIISKLEEAYCGTIAVEYEHMIHEEKVNFLKERLENPKAYLSKEDKIINFKRLVQAQKFEEFLAKKWTAEKRFGLEGLEAMIPSMKTVIDVAAESGLESVIIGMPHRGRLNVLANVVRKDISQVFSQFNKDLELDDYDATGQSGDVKYHLGVTHERYNYKTKKPISVSVVANPSHLEAVDPVVQGKVKAEQFYRNDEEGDKVMGILIHGDAAFAGQGVVYETFHLSDLDNYTTHGTIHIVANNQIGFTTDPRFSRSSDHCTDVAKVVGAPILHVNADDPDAVATVSRIAGEFRQTFKEDIVINIVGYRRHGHNEIDNPMFTQPAMYQIIAKHKPILQIYGEQLEKEGIMSQQEQEFAIAGYEELLEAGLKESKNIQTLSYNFWLDSPWKHFFQDDFGTIRNQFPPTGITEERILDIGRKVSKVPEGFNLHSGLNRIFKGREKMLQNRQVDWALGEAIAYGSLLTEGTHVRLSGQDIERGTFSHRHYKLHDQKVFGDIDVSNVTKFEENFHVPLEHLSEDQAKISLCNSSLSEYGVLGFELGYSMTNPNQLVLWEAQFGDFSNTAQPIIDQFISAGEHKWIRQKGLVMLLPHGYEGMGPEHSSARLERFLQMANDDPDIIPSKINDDDFKVSQLQSCNWIVANITTPANFFHLLRRQIKMPFRKPLIVMSPKFLLRHPEARSSFDDMLEDATFKRIIADSDTNSSQNVKRILFCSGKVFIDLKEERAKRNLTANDVTIVRIEQLSPFPSDLVKKELDKFPEAKVYWCQEEHKNMGPFEYAKQRIRSVSGWSRRVNYAGRPVSASAASGSKQGHNLELRMLLDQAFEEL